jgi:hypothetical protein
MECPALMARLILHQHSQPRKGLLNCGSSRSGFRQARRAQPGVLLYKLIAREYEWPKTGIIGKESAAAVAPRHEIVSAAPIPLKHSALSDQPQHFFSSPTGQKLVLMNKGELRDITRETQGQIRDRVVSGVHVHERSTDSGRHSRHSI